MLTITVHLIVDACIITSGYNEDIISSLIGEMIFKNLLKNDTMNFSAIGVGKWGSIRECYDLDERFVEQRYSHDGIQKGYVDTKIKLNLPHIH